MPGPTSPERGPAPRNLERCREDFDTATKHAQEAFEEFNAPETTEIIHEKTPEVLEKLRDEAVKRMNEKIEAARSLAESFEN